MAFEPKIVQRAMARLESAAREGRERKRWDLEQRLYQQEPELRDLDRALRGTMVELTDLIAAGKPVQADGPEISAIRQKNLDLQAQRAELLHALGYPPDALDRKPACPKCGDTGWNGTEMCSCLKQLCTQEQFKELTSLLNLTEEQSFARLRLDVYSDRPWQGMARSPGKTSTRVVAVCEGFARQFPSYPLKNLLLSGGTGLGKTFCPAASPGRCRSRASPWCTTPPSACSPPLSPGSFPGTWRKAVSPDETRRYLHCDLLILDDLGSELTTPLSSPPCTSSSTAACWRTSARLFPPICP